MPCTRAVWEDPTQLSLGVTDPWNYFLVAMPANLLPAVSWHVSSQGLYSTLNDEGAADNMTFYESGSSVESDGSRKAQRKRTFGGPNGLFFALFIMRTSSPVAVASALFGTSETTGGRAFSTWVNFSAKPLRPLVRLPLPHEVALTAPENFVASNLSKIILILDATEVEVDRVRHKDAAYVLCSTYKSKPTGKVLIASPPGGAICYVSGVYGGRLSDAELVRESGLLDDLRLRGFASGGFHVMADRGFNSLAPLLMQDEIHFVAPPWKRQGEDQFTEADANLTQEIANRRIHVERAFGAMEKWRILDTRFSSKELDHMGMCFQAIGGLVNLLQQPFAS